MNQVHEAQYSESRSVIVMTKRNLSSVFWGIFCIALSHTGAYAQTDEILEQAWLGNVEAQFALASMYDDETLDDVDASEAFFWFRRSAEQGYTSSFLPVGFAYLNGHGVPKDIVRAHFWFTVGAVRTIGDERTTAVLQRDATASQMSERQLEASEELVLIWSPRSEVSAAVSTEVEPQPPRILRQPAAVSTPGRISRQPVSSTLVRALNRRSPDRRQTLINFVYAQSDGITATGAEVRIMQFGTGRFGGMINVGGYFQSSGPGCIWQREYRASGQYEVCGMRGSVSAYRMSVSGGPVWRYKGNTRVTPHVGLFGGMNFAQRGADSNTSPMFGVAFPVLTRMQDKTAFAIEPSFAHVWYDGRGFFEVLVKIGISLDLGS